MAYKLSYQIQVSWVGAGAGPMAALSAPSLAGQGGSTGQQAEFSVNPAVLPVSATFLAADVTNLTNAMAADIAAQLNVAATLAKIQAWSSGNP
jgi:hypothetical protein